MFRKLYCVEKKPIVLIFMEEPGPTARVLPRSDVISFFFQGQIVISLFFQGQIGVSDQRYEEIHISIDPRCQPTTMVLPF